LEGTFSSDSNVGAWLTSACRVLRGLGAPFEEEWPYVSDPKLWPPKEPPGIDESAKKNRIFAYQRIISEEQFKIAIVAGTFPSVTMAITESWYTAPNGRIRLPVRGERFVGAHCVFLYGYDDTHRHFRFQNSWGESWGDKGRGYLPYGYLDRMITEGWMKVPHPDIVLDNNKSGFVERYWGIGTPLHGTLHGVEIREVISNDRLCWSFATKYDNYLNIEEFFVRPDFRGRGYAKRMIDHFSLLSSDLSLPLRFWIAHPDANPSSMSAIAYLAQKYGYEIQNSGVRWAAYKLIKGRSSYSTKSLAPSTTVPKATGIGVLGRRLNESNQK
jgi:GNAT superfamily N-acetyltransferase